MVRKHSKNRKSFFGRPVWRNSIKTIKVEPLRYYTPENLRDVVTMVQEGIDHNIPVRAVGSGHSFSDAPQSEGILLDTDKLNKIAPFQHAGGETYLEVEGGTKLRNLNDKLEELGLCIPTMGGIDHQSIAGAISTGTHGSSMGFGGMSKMVKSIVLVTHDQNDLSKAKAYRIEPKSAPLTDPSGYDGPELILDDNIFNSALVCFGLMGIIFSYILEVEKMYYLKECRKMTTWDEIKNDLRTGVIFDNRQGVLVQINPYKEEHLALLITHERYDHTDKNLIAQKVKHKIGDNLKRMTRSLSFTFASIFPYFLYYVIWRINRYPKYIPRFIDAAIRSQRDEEYINKGHKVMYQGLDFIKERAYDCEIAIEMDSEGRYVTFIDQLIDYLAKLHEQFQIHVTSPLGLRFVCASTALMAADNGFNTCYIDTPVLKSIYGREVLLSKIQQFAIERKARLHWGKINSHIDAGYTKTAFPGYPTFISVIQKFNPKKTFSNHFTKRVVGY